MERSNKIAQAYGYAVCFIAVVTILFSSKSIIDAAFDLSAPLRADRYRSDVSLTSFETYKRERLERRPAPVNNAPDSARIQWTDQQLRQMFEDARVEQIDDVRFRAMRSLVSSIILIAIASLLFFTHWRWLRKESAVT